MTDLQWVSNIKNTHKKIFSQSLQDGKIRIHI